MRDRSQILEQACAAMMAGDGTACEAALERFRSSTARRPLDPAEAEQCQRQLERLRGIASAVCEGIESAQSWLAELIDATGMLEVYDRGGRQRVSTTLDASARRF